MQRGRGSHEVIKRRRRRNEWKSGECGKRGRSETSVTEMAKLKK